MSGWFRFAVLIAACVLLVGCGPSKKVREMQAVSGSVTLDGEPLASGEIYFKTTAKGEIDLLAIENGQFQGEVGVGKRRVEIYAYREKMVVPMPGEPPEKTRENYLPAAYNLQSELSAEVGPDSSGPLKFEIKSK